MRMGGDRHGKFAANETVRSASENLPTHSVAAWIRALRAQSYTSLRSVIGRPAYIKEDAFVLAQVCI
jgi:hypothetical protein